MKTYLAWVWVGFGLAACGGTTIDGLDAATDGSGGGDAASGACSANVPCGNGEICGYAASDGCSATGKCLPSGPMCNGFAPGCACDGTTINIMCTGLPNGYDTAPLAHAGTCGSPVTDGGSGAYTCDKQICTEGQDLCYLPANNPGGGACMSLDGCTDCTCAQSHFQCISQCKQSGQQIYIQCQ